MERFKQFLIRRPFLNCSLFFFFGFFLVFYWPSPSLLDLPISQSTSATGGGGCHSGETSTRITVSSILDVSYRPWEDDPQCQEYNIQFIRDGSRPVMALVSYPGSGNTWTRGIIERLTGYFTGSVYTAKDLVMKRFYGEAVPVDCGCTVVQKTHDFRAGVNDFDKRFINSSAILIIRNPYGSLVSYRNYLRTDNNQTASASSSEFTGPGWKKFVLREIERWQSTALRWIPRIGKGGILHYDDLVRDRRKYFRLLVKYLGLEVDERRLECVIKHDFNTYKRHSSSGGSNSKFDPFDSNLRGVVNRAIGKVQAALIDVGYDFQMQLKE